MTNDPRRPLDTPDEGDRLLDDAIRAARLGPDDAASAEAKARVRAFLFAGTGTHAGSPCESLRPLLPGLVAGRLSEDRAELVADHCRECVPCRKEMIALREGRSAVAPAPVPAMAAPRRRGRLGALAGLAAAAAAIAAIVMLVPNGPSAEATVADVRGQLLDARTGEAIPAGTRLAENRAVRTGKDARAVLLLPDGSRVELNERAQASFDQDGEALTLDLQRGDLIFEAAHRKERNLLVKTDDCTVAVKGTVFTVRHGLKGSRVGVLEGSVHVDRAGAATSVLGAGEQVATDPSLSPQPLSEQVAWSLDASRWADLLGEIEAAALAVEKAHPRAQPRYASPILDAMPGSTVLFAAVPNDGELSALASEISARVSAHPQLGEWWNQQLDPDSGSPASLAVLLDTLRRLSDSLGEEVVFALLETGSLQEPPMPVMVAGVRDEAGLRQLVADLAPEEHATAFTDAATLAKMPAGMLREPVLVLHAGHVMVSPSADALRLLAAGFDGRGDHSANGFLAGLEGRYDRGAEYLVAADLGRTVGRRAEAAAEQALLRGEEQPSRLVQALGIPAVDQFVLTAGAEDPGTAVLSFREDRSGMAAWLAEPGPMGSLDFVTADASLATAALFEDPRAMLADLEAMLPEGKLEELLKSLLDETGVDVRSDLVGSLGGEMALALDGPLLPQPSWKLVLEVDDAERFEAALLAVAERAAEAARQDGAEVPTPLMRQTKAAGHDARALRFGPLELHYALSGGYFVAVPNLQLLEAALQASSRGSSLSRAPKLVGLLPGGDDEQLSLVAWQDASRILGDLRQGAGASLLPGEAGALLAAASTPALGWGRAGDRAITFGVNSPDGALGSGLAPLLRRHVVEALSLHALTAREAAREDAGASVE